MVGEMNKQRFQPSVSKIGDMEAKWMILIAYFGAAVLGFVPGVKYVAWLIPLIIFLIDKENKFIAFHAIQAFLLEIVATVIYIILGIIAVVSTTSAMFGMASLNSFGVGAGVGAVIATAIAGIVIGIFILIFMILAAVRGYNYEIYEIPLVGKWAERIVFKTAN